MTIHWIDMRSRNRSHCLHTIRHHITRRIGNPREKMGQGSCTEQIMMMMIMMIMTMMMIMMITK
jgi:hypothetical protein